MPESLKIIGVIIIMMLVVIWSRKFRATQMIKARDFIIDDLKSKGAVKPESAIPLTYAQRSLFRIGLRDDRPKMLRQMIQYGIVGVTENNRFFLNEANIPSGEQT